MRASQESFDDSRAQMLIVDLSPEDQREFENAAQALKDGPVKSVNDARWPVVARQMAHTKLPNSVRLAVAEFSRDPGSDGALLVRGLPIDDDLGPTPDSPESAQREPTVSAAVLSLIAEYLGHMTSFRSEKGGALVHDVAPVPGKEEAQANFGSVTLQMHTENAFHPNRPDYVMLLCCRPDPEDKAALTFSSIRRALSHLTEESLDVLRQERFITHAPPSFEGLDGAVRKPILSGAEDDPDLCVDFWSTEPADDGAKMAMRELGDALGQHTKEHRFQTGDLVVVDNRLVVHGRSAFRPRYDGTDRWLQRSFVVVDRRASRADRPDDGHIQE